MNEQKKCCADAARQANERADRLCTALRERDRISADVERAMEDAARQARDDAMEVWQKEHPELVWVQRGEIAELVRQARAEVADRVHVAGCDCHEFRPHRNLLDRPCQREGCGEYHADNSYVSSNCLAEREKVREGK